VAQAPPIALGGPARDEGTVASVRVDPFRIHTFPDAESFATWLAANHDREPELWIRIAKKGSGIATVTPAEAIDICLCWGWIDGIRKGLDETSFLQRYTPRGPKSLWSKVNVGNVARLIAEGRMTEHGLRHVEAAKADGRWQSAYRIKGAIVPPDLMAAIDAEPAARATFATLTAQNRFALIHRTESTRTAAGRAEAIARFVAMLARGETIHPQKR
jgi:uncharacterized protein YdeI (YjbR/CyaY-like superfamily)